MQEALIPKFCSFSSGNSSIFTESLGGSFGATGGLVINGGVIVEDENVATVEASSLFFGVGTGKYLKLIPGD